ncbi:MAG: hypothetical protein ACI88G_002107 [Woeseiaceae bacterium]|jgi:hypothetical protein
MDTPKIVRLVALLFAVVAGVVTIPESAMIIAILGLVGGYFVEEDRRIHFLLATLTLALVHGALGPIPVIGGYLTDILGSMSSLFNAGACTVIVVATIDRVKP